MLPCREIGDRKGVDMAFEEVRLVSQAELTGNREEGSLLANVLGGRMVLRIAPELRLSLPLIDTDVIDAHL